jgi:hypothetical protein
VQAGSPFLVLRQTRQTVFREGIIPHTQEMCRIRPISIAVGTESLREFDPAFLLFPSAGFQKNKKESRGIFLQAVSEPYFSWKALS